MDTNLCTNDQTCTSLSWFASRTRGRHPCNRCNTFAKRPSFQDLQGRLGHSSDRSFPRLSPQAMGHVTWWLWRLNWNPGPSTHATGTRKMQIMQQLDCKKNPKRTGTKSCQLPCCNWWKQIVDAEWVDLQNNPTRKGHLPVHMKMVDRRVFSLAVAGGSICNISSEWSRLALSDTYPPLEPWTATQKNTAICHVLACFQHKPKAT